MAKVIPFRSPFAPEVYSPAMKTFHWLTVAMVLALLAIGWTMTSGLETIKPILAGLFALHKSLGVSVLFLTLARIFWRTTHLVPQMPPALRPWEILAFKTVHNLLYAVLLLQPLVGWMIITLSKHASLFFGLFPIPDLPFLSGLQNPEAVQDFLEDLHGAGAVVLAVVLALHAGAALRHHFMIRDNVLLRMSPAFLAPALRRLRKERP